MSAAEEARRLLAEMATEMDDGFTVTTNRRNALALHDAVRLLAERDALAADLNSFAERTLAAEARLDKLRAAIGDPEEFVAEAESWLAYVPEFFLEKWDAAAWTDQVRAIAAALEDIDG